MAILHATIHSWLCGQRPTLCELYLKDFLLPMLCSTSSLYLSMLILECVQLGAGVLSDLWGSEERGRSLAIYTLVPLLGPTIGPTAGGYVVQNYSWRWIFIGSSVFTALFLILGLLLLRETFAPLLLKRRRALSMAHRSERNNISMLFPNRPAAFVKLVRFDLARPFIMLTTQPIIQTVSLFMAYLFGLNFLTISTFQTLWEKSYGQSVSEGSLNYISISLGFVVGCEIAGPLNDRVSSPPPFLHIIFPRRFASYNMGETNKSCRDRTRGAQVPMCL